MIRINTSTVMLFGRECALYGVIAVLGAALITVLNALLARRRGLDASFTFRLTLPVVFGIVAFHVFLQDVVPDQMLNWLYPCSFLALPLLMGMGARVFQRDVRSFASLGIFTGLSYGTVARCCCIFGGCCYGPPRSGGLTMVYGAHTNNPLPGVELFPLQPLMAVLFLALAVFGAVVFLKKGPQILLWIAAALNLLGYYMAALVSPANQINAAVGFGMILLVSVAVTVLLTYYFIKKGRCRL